MMKTKISKIPDFKSIQEEAKFWDNHDFTEFINEARPVKLTVDLALPKEELITVKLQSSLKGKLSQLAQEMGIGVSTLVRMWLVERLRMVK